MRVSRHGLALGRTIGTDIYFDVDKKRWETKLHGHSEQSGKGPNQKRAIAAKNSKTPRQNLPEVYRTPPEVDIFLFNSYLGKGRPGVMAKLGAYMIFIIIRGLDLSFSLRVETKPRTRTAFPVSETCDWIVIIKQKNSPWSPKRSNHELNQAIFWVGATEYSAGGDPKAPPCLLNVHSRILDDFSDGERETLSLSLLIYVASLDLFHLVLSLDFLK